MGGQVGAKLEPSWFIQGFKMVCKSYFNVKMIFHRKMLLLDPQGGGSAAWARHLVATWEYCILVPKVQYFQWPFNVLRSRACARAMKTSPKGDVLQNNHHDNVI